MRSDLERKVVCHAALKHQEKGEEEEEEEKEEEEEEEEEKEEEAAASVIDVRITWVSQL